MYRPVSVASVAHLNKWTWLIKMKPPRQITLLSQSNCFLRWLWNYSKCFDIPSVFAPRRWLRHLSITGTCRLLAAVTGWNIAARRKPRTWQNLMVRMTNLPAGRAAVAVSRLSSPGLTKTKWGECENCRERREFETRQKLATNWFSPRAASTASSSPAVRSFVVKMRTHHAGSK